MAKRVTCLAFFVVIIGIKRKMNQQIVCDKKGMERYSNKKDKREK